MLDLANRRFILQDNASGHASTDTVMQFGPNRFPWLATYAGSNVKQGQAIVGLQGEALHMIYHACNLDDSLSAGEAVITLTESTQPSQHSLVMQLNWRWISGNNGQGISVWHEVPGQPTQRVRSGAYGLITRGTGQAREILLCRISAQLPHSAGRWTLPGGGIEFAEHPEQAMIREVEEETGLQVRQSNLLGVDSWVVEQNNVAFHALGYLYQAQVQEGELRTELDGTTDLAAWHKLHEVEHLETVGLVHKGLRLLTT